MIYNSYGWYISMKVKKSPYFYCVYPLDKGLFRVGSTHDSCPGHITLSSPTELSAGSNFREFCTQLGRLSARIEPFEVRVVGKSGFGHTGDIEAIRVQDTILLHLSVLALAQNCGFSKFDKKWAFMDYNPHSVALAELENPPNRLLIDSIAVMTKRPDSPHTVSGLYILGQENNY